MAGVLVLTGLGWSVGAPGQAVAAARCSAFDHAVVDQVNPRTRAQLLTYRTPEARTYQSAGFTTERGEPIMAATDGGPGLAAVHRLSRASNGNLFYTADRNEAVRARRYGYRDQGVAFYASRTPASCLVPVYSFLRSGVHRYSTLPGERAILRDAGWKPEGVRFYAGRPRTDEAFSLAVLPDTQQEVLRAGDTRFVNRSRFLVSRRSSLDLRFVTHTGDVVNWDTSDHVQYRRAAAALQPLNDARLPYSLSPGNHDTGAVCRGGGACAGASTRTLVRQTSSFNRYLDRGTAEVEGRYEAGKVDNTYSRFSAGGVRWLVLNLELWPRAGAVGWAQRVVAGHPGDNVVVVTHSYLTAGGAIYNRSDYGGDSPRELYDQLVSRYPNIRVVLSGHTGRAATRTDTGVHGNKIVSLMLTMHDNVTNPIRFVEVNTAADTLNTWVYSPYTATGYRSYSRSYAGMHWIR